MKEIEVSIGGKERFANGAEVRVKSLAQVREGVIPSEVSLHEAEHIVPNPDNVDHATINPGPGYRGRTKLRRFDPAAAAGPHANRRRGTDHDMWMVEHSGAGVSSSIMAAKSALLGKEKHVIAVASLLEERRTISGGEAKAAIEEVDLGKKVQVEVLTQDGKKYERTERVKGETVMIPGELFDLPKAA